MQMAWPNDMIPSLSLIISSLYVNVYPNMEEYTLGLTSDFNTKLALDECIRASKKHEFGSFV